MGIQKDLKELTDANVISAEIAENITRYYAGKAGNNQNRLLVAFGVLGALLVGLGVILIVAHNWDEFERSTKTCFAFLPLLIGQVFCFYTLFRKRDSASWIESSATFLFLAIGASISLVSQVYHIEGNLSSFLLTWMLIALPLIYIMKSQAAAMLYIVGITWFACEAGYSNHRSPQEMWYWILLLAVVPHYVMKIKSNPDGNALVFLHWFFPLSLVISLGTLEHDFNESFTLVFIFLFACMSILGDLPWLQRRHTAANGYLVLGSFGSTVMLFPLSFASFWEEIRRDHFDLNMYSSAEFIGTILLFLTACYLLWRLKRSQAWNEMRPSSWMFLVFTIIFLIGLYEPIAVVLTNLLLLATGVVTVFLGAKRNHLGLLNYGLIIITALVICRFFDTDLSFVIRGLLFVIVGAGFFAANYLMIQKRKTHEK